MAYYDDKTHVAVPKEPLDGMAYAFHNALTDGSLGADEVDEIKKGLLAAIAAAPAPEHKAVELAKNQLINQLHAQHKCARRGLDFSEGSAKEAVNLIFDEMAGSSKGRASLAQESGVGFESRPGHQEPKAVEPVAWMANNSPVIVFDRAKKQAPNSYKPFNIPLFPAPPDYEALRQALKDARDDLIYAASCLKTDGNDPIDKRVVRINELIGE